MYLMMPLTFTLLASYPRLRRYCGPVGLLITVGSLILSSYATEVWQLIASQGVLCAIGSGLLFSPTTLYLDEWFVTRKGMAYGVMWAGKAASGVVFPFLMSSLLKNFGPRTTLQAWAVALLIITTPLLYFLKPRIPVSNVTAHRRLSWTFLKHSTFWMMQLGNVVQALGYLLPLIYLASYTTALGFSSTIGAILITLNNLMSVPGGIVVGMLGDGNKSTSVVLLTSLGSTMTVFLLWGLAKHLSLLIIFALTYGFFAGAFSSTYPGMLQEMKKVDESLDTGLVMGLLLGGRGLGFVVGGPISASLLEAGSRKMGWGYDGQYGPVIVATGATALLGGWGWMWKIVKRAV
jgi:MFS family permease